ncbi:tail fiber domain-containing protein [Flavobacterium dankookense]|uniref:Endosialidase-like protein n=1 Tax=Flavobacterium dankookense TaxID=706186 RepID=A0A4R6Q4U1_9FLAO|nr:tail fiber domain-containing protein [Flavobacterium dankookense]TDP57388.1 endosialidase-like protein [Flavobacterium dankookense]
MKKILTLLLVFPFLSLAQVGIGTTTPKAALDVESTNNGMLIPRVQLTSTLDATTVVNPNAGPLETSTLVYNIAAAGTVPNNVVAGFYYWNGSQWTAISGNTVNNWSLTGNAGTNPTTLFGSNFSATENFIGTSDYEDLLFGTDNRPLLKMTAFGNIGIGVNNPNAKFEIEDNSPYITGWIKKTNSSGSIFGGSYVSPTFVVSTTSTNGGTNEIYRNAEFHANGINTATNVAAYFRATQASNNYAVIVPENGGYVGIGTEIPTSKLNVQTIDENIGITNNLIKNSGAGTSSNLDNNMTINNNNQAYGIRNSFLGTGNGLKIGVRNTAASGILGSKIGFENNFQASGNSFLYGLSNTLTHTGSDLTLGVYNQITNPLGSTGTTHGIENRMTNNSTLEATGVFTEINSPDGGSGGSFGVQNIIGGRKTGGKIGMRNQLSTNISTPDNIYGVENLINASSTSVIIGLKNNLTANGDALVTGNDNYIDGNTSFRASGVSTVITNSGNGVHCGTSNILNGSGNGAKYGVFSNISPTAGGQHFGVFAQVLKSGNNYAGYFNGKVAIGSNVNLGIDDYVFPMARGTNGQIMQTDGSGNLSWQNPSTVLGSAVWSLTGNSITAGTHFIGSTNNVDVSFRRNGTNIGYLGQTNLAFGIGALQPSVGLYNVAIGVDALSSLTAADQNVAVGWNALSNVTTGGNNIGIGTGATVPVAANNNQIRMGNVNIAYAGVQVAWSVTSDSRWKDNIKPSNLGLDFINKLNPVFYTRKNDETQKTEYGFIAQELDKTLNEAGATNNGIITKDDQGMLSVRYNDLIAPMVKAIQELKEENNKLKTQNENLEERLKKIEEKLSR